MGALSQLMSYFFSDTHKKLWGIHTVPSGTGVVLSSYFVYDMVRRIKLLSHHVMSGIGSDGGQRGCYCY